MAVVHLNHNPIIHDALDNHDSFHITATDAHPPYRYAAHFTHFHSYISFTPCEKQYAVQVNVDLNAVTAVVSKSPFLSVISTILFCVVRNSLSVA